ncbi:ribosome assembly RNA-binding protein YhbY [Azospira inquinata]|uniref:Ribosome assembly RNA-binding protein YhbY n=1 Tax=Azospira inquinata TaxID=2785627 RepID=A0A975XUA2_9RHOO|nr:ribosome assembly RNA-binding protein YhbY [Azospira inquinata]QWT46085.1 ribosome assembly RNA-binding protein YhbY [Azospira inquinata]QWT48586.1 ribosome assembly RNA-binding protein YhbY [Azospira inquinata]
MLSLSPVQRRALKARAHALNPVVSISQHGLTENVLKEIDANLKSHELIKVRVYNDDREVREQYLNDICTQLDAAPVQHIGKLLVVYRPAPEDAQAAAAARRTPGRNQRRSKRSFQS